MTAAVETACSPYQVALDRTFEALDPEVRRAHLAPLVAVGSVDVERGSHWLARRLVRLLKLPNAGPAQPVRLEVTAEGDELLWSRRIGSVCLRTRQRAVGARIEERAGLGTITFRLRAESGALLYRQTSFRVAGMRVPPAIAPLVAARVSAASRGWHVEVHVTWRAHLVCRYAGRMAVA